MQNVFDIMYEEQLNYIWDLDDDFDCSTEKKVAVFVYLYYVDTIAFYCKYLENVPQNCDLYVISSQELVLNEVMNALERGNVEYILKPNSGRDVSALLIECAKYIMKYEYACFIHDKKAHTKDIQTEVEMWIENIWSNLLGSKSYIAHIISLFEEENKIGVIVPPPPIGNHFSVWQGFGWYGACGITKKICERLRIVADIDISKPPLAIGTALWFRIDAMKKLYEYQWRYEDFNDALLDDAEYFCYGIERIFPFVAHDAGFYTAEVMNTKYAAFQNRYLRYSSHQYMQESQEYFPLKTIHEIEIFNKNKDLLLNKIDGTEVYLYGAGRFGKLCLSLLRRNNICVLGFIVSKIDCQRQIDSLTVKNVEDFASNELEEATIIITVENKYVCEEIEAMLKIYHCKKVLRFWYYDLGE